MKQINKFFILFLLFIFISAQSPEKGLNAINENVVKAQLEFLASDWTEGRATAEKGEYIAGDYIASMYKLYGLKPAGDYIMSQTRSRRGVMPSTTQPMERTYFQSVPLIEITPSSNQQLSIITNNNGVEQKYNLTYKTDFDLNVSSTGVELTSNLVFVGYGITDNEKKYDDFKNIDVRGKIIIRLSGFPGHTDPNSPGYKTFNPSETRQLFELMQNKNKRAIELGAIGVIEITEGLDPNLRWATNIPFRYNTDVYEADEKLPSFSDKRLVTASDLINTSLTTITLSKRTLNLLLADSRIDTKKYEENAKLLKNQQSFILKNKSLYLKTTVNSRMVIGRNVVGMIEGENKDEVLVVGAHYDHIGKYNGFVWNGADDNASGSVGVMTIAKGIMESGIKPKKTIVFACWTGEEKGLIGSRYFANNHYLMPNVIFNLNYDMIGRDSKEDTEGNTCGFSYTADYPILQELTEKNLVKYNIDLKYRFNPSARPGGGSDHASFASKNITVVAKMTAMHDDYHKPSDHIEKINFKKMTNVIKSGYLLIFDLANSNIMLKK